MIRLLLRLRMRIVGRVPLFPELVPAAAAEIVCCRSCFHGLLRKNPKNKNDNQDWQACIHVVDYGMDGVAAAATRVPVKCSLE